MSTITYSLSLITFALMLLAACEPSPNNASVNDDLIISDGLSLVANCENGNTIIKSLKYTTLSVDSIKELPVYKSCDERLKTLKIAYRHAHFRSKGIKLTGETRIRDWSSTSGDSVEFEDIDLQLIGKLKFEAIPISRFKPDSPNF